MKRPEYQWFITDYSARRLNFGSEYQLLEKCRSLGFHESLLEQISLAINNKERIELFSLENQRSDTSRNDETISHGYCLFCPQVQIVHYLKETNRPLSLNDIAFAAQSWLIARGFDDLQLRTSQNEELLSSLDPVYTQKILGIDRLNSLSSLLEFNPRSQIEGILIDQHRVITLAPSNLDLCHALNITPQVIACEDSSHFPAKFIAQDKVTERLGPDLAPNIDRVIELAPSIILSSLSVPGMERIVTKLRVTRQKQFILAPRSFSQVINNIKDIGELLGVSKQAKTLIKDLYTQRDALIEDRQEPLVPIYLEWWPKPMFTPGSQCFSNELIELAGGVNIFKERVGSSVEVSCAELIDKAPKLCFISWCGVPLTKLNTKKLVDRKGLEQLDEQTKTQVFPIDEAFTGRPGPYMLEASRQMAKAIKAYLKKMT